MTYPMIDENKFVDICMRELGNHDDVDEKIAYAIAITLNSFYCKGMEFDERK